MGQLFLVDDDITQEELLKQISDKYILTAKSKDARFLGKKKVNIRQKTKTKSGMSSSKIDSEIDDVISSSTCQTCTSATQLYRTAVKGAVKKVQVDDDEIPGNSRQAKLDLVNRKRKTNDVIEGSYGKNYAKRTRKNSCEILKDELRRSISTLNRAKSILDTDSLEIIDDMHSFYGEEECSEEPATSKERLTPPGYTPLQHRNRDWDKVGLNYVQELKNGTCDDNQGSCTSSCTVTPNFGPKKAKIKVPTGSARTVRVDEDTNIASRFRFEKTDEVHNCDNYGIESHNKESSAESSSSSRKNRVSESRAATSEWILHDKDNSCLKRIFDADCISAVALTDLDGTNCENDKDLSQVDKAVRLPAAADIPDWMYVAIDCEMVGVGPKGKQSVLARCSIVDYNGCVIYDKYIRPSETITDYRTPWSGIRPVHMKTAVPISQALQDIRECLAHKVVIGHAVYHDFRVLRITPDPHFVRDTAQCPQLVEMAQLQGKGNSLKKLSEALLDRKIQVSKQGHCSVEDARATLDLFKLVRHSWEPVLYLKWSKKMVDIFNKVASFVAMATRQRDMNSVDDFLNDMFWPSHITE